MLDGLRIRSNLRYEVMKIILLDVMSLDSKLTRWKEKNIYKWSSHEDYQHFCRAREENNLLVMGSGTFNAVRPMPEKERLRIVMTTQPEKYKKFMVNGQLEFTNEKPKELVKRLVGLGYEQMLLVGGKRIATAFLKEHLINELWLTIEPRIFGQGEALVSMERMDVSLELFHFERLNKKGTILLKYKVL